MDSIPISQRSLVTPRELKGMLTKLSENGIASVKLLRSSGGEAPSLQTAETHCTDSVHVTKFYKQLRPNDLFISTFNSAQI